MTKHTFWHYLATVVLTLIKGVVASLVWIIVGVSGYLVYSTKGPYGLIIGLPLILIGGGLFLNSLGSFVLSVFSPKYNKGICTFCAQN